MTDDWIDEEEFADYAAAERYQGRLMRHPDCFDPDHPGCELCREENDD